MGKFGYSGSLSAIAIAMIAMTGQQAHAQTSEPAAEDIIVTGRQFYSPNTVSSSKLQERIAEAPQSIAVLDEKLFQDIGVRNYLDATYYIPGVAYQGSYGNFPVILARGYGVGGANSYRLNGAPLGVAKPLDSVAVQQVEFVRGGSGTTFGEGGPGGFINIITRRGGDKLGVTGGLQYGSFDYLRGEATLGGPLTASGNVRGIVGASYEQDGGFGEIEDFENYAFYAALDFDIGDNAQLNLIGYHSRNRLDGLNNGWPLIPLEGGGFGAPELLPNRAGTALPWAYDLLKISYVRAEFTYKFSDAFNVALLAGYTRSTNDALLADLCCEIAPDYTTQQYYYFQGNKTESTNLEARVFGELDFGSVTSKYLISAEYRERYREDGFSDYIEIDPAYDLLTRPRTTPNPNAGLTEDEFIIESFVRDIDVYSISALSITELTDRLTVTLGARYDDFTPKSTTFIGNFAEQDGPTESFPSDNWAFRGAAMYELLPKGRFYYSYGQTFEINNAVTCDNTPLPPETGRIHEIGYKQELSGGRLLFSAAAYDIKSKGNAVFLGFGCPNGAAIEAFGPGNGQKSKGFEVELQGQVTRNWNIFAGYAYTDAKLISEDPDIGAFPTNGVPQHQVTLFTVYDLLDGPLKGVGFGGGFIYQDSHFLTNGEVPEDRFKRGDLFRADLALYYRPASRWSFALNIKNVFDSKDAFSALNTTEYQNFWMAPRTFLLSAEFKM